MSTFIYLSIWHTLLNTYPPLSPYCTYWKNHLNHHFQFFVLIFKFPFRKVFVNNFPFEFVITKQFCQIQYFFQQTKLIQSPKIKLNTIELKSLCITICIESSDCTISSIAVQIHDHSFKKSKTHTSAIHVFKRERTSSLFISKTKMKNIGKRN